MSNPGTSYLQQENMIEGLAPEEQLSYILNNAPTMLFKTIRAYEKIKNDKPQEVSDEDMLKQMEKEIEEAQEKLNQERNRIKKGGTKTTLVDELAGQLELTTKKYEKFQKEVKKREAATLAENLPMAFATFWRDFKYNLKKEWNARKK